METREVGVRPSRLGQRSRNREHDASVVATLPLRPRALHGLDRARCGVDSPSTRRWIIGDETHDFMIKDGQDTRTVAGRKAAIDRAKQISERTWRTIGLERDDGRVRMQFRRGALESYRFETRDRR